jgi:pilus assembly protein CpaB
MNPARIIIVLVAGVAAIALALFVRNMAAAPKPAATIASVAAPPAPPMARVLVAKANLAVGERLALENMSWQDWPAATVNAAYITDGLAAAPTPAGAVAAVNHATKTVTDLATGGGPKMQAVVGDIVREPIYAGEPITSAKIVRSGDSSYMAVRLPEGMRAMALPINVESGAGGFIQPGDRIDVLSTHANGGRGSSGAMVTQMVISNVLVLAVDQHTDSPKTGATLLGATVTLEVPVDMVATVARAHSQGGLTMALRSYADIGGKTATPSGIDGGTVRLFKGGGPAELVTAQ